MPRNISFSITTEQVLNRTKTVTRRAGWERLKIGEILNGCKKCMGLQPGEKIERLCKIRVTALRREKLRAMTDAPEYGFRETALEGFPAGDPKHDPAEFVAMFCRSHSGVTPESTITRIEFEYVD
tara:strand:- start:294 stop:668 length:375 start_codon:yes stop_codon:yes gene_type:complete